jgi:hypothetical protein
VRVLGVPQRARSPLSGSGYVGLVRTQTPTHVRTHARRLTLIHGCTRAHTRTHTHTHTHSLNSHRHARSTRTLTHTVDVFVCLSQGDVAPMAVRASRASPARRATPAPPAQTPRWVRASTVQYRDSGDSFAQLHVCEYSSTPVSTRLLDYPTSCSRAAAPATSCEYSRYLVGTRVPPVSTRTSYSE